MSDLNTCPRCDGPMPNDGELAGGCPRCMLELGFETSIGGRVRPDQNVAAERPAVIGRYRILRLIGEGGMGAVYEAEQDTPRRTVALKIIKSGMASAELLRRFEQESQALGRLQHPGIAQIYEAGTVDTGFGPQPYFAMEFIRGVPPRDYSEAHQLNTNQRLEIMAKICEAVHHAHQRGLIHRDLKPANILVDDTGQPKILDFGVARVTDSDTRSTLQTDMGQLIGTLAYMSPEQVLADPLDIDTRSDVYSLGVIFYEFLSGRLPYPISKKLHETIQTIREADPEKLSSINRSFRGDIENIVARALEKDRTRRYASAEGMADDIRRYLKDEPIVARPPSATYQLTKFTRRHKALVSGVAAVFVVLVGGVSFATWEARRATRLEEVAVVARDQAQSAERAASIAGNRAIEERQRADMERDRALKAERFSKAALNRAIVERQRTAEAANTAKALNDFLRDDLLTVADPGKQLVPGQANLKPNPNLTVREALDRAAARIAGRFDTQPLVEAALRETIAETYFGLGANQEARNQFEQAVALRRREQGSSHPQTLNSTMRLAHVLFASRLFPATENLIRRIVEDDRKGHGQDNPATRSAIALLLSIYTTLYNKEKELGLPSAEALLKDVIDHDRQRFGDDNPTTRQAIPILVALYRIHQPPQYAEAEGFLKQLLADQTRRLGDDNAASVLTMTELVRLYIQQDKNVEAENLLIPLVSDSAVNRILQVGHVATNGEMSMLGSMSLLSQVYGRLGKTQQADVLARAVRTLRGIQQGSATVRTLEYLDPVYPSNPRYSDDEAALENLIATQRELLGPTHAQTMTSMQRLAEVYAAEFAFYRLRGEAEMARLSGENGAEYYKRYLSVQRTAPGAETSQMTRLIMFGLASIQATLENYTEAELLIREVMALQENAANAQQAAKRSSLVFIGWLQFQRQRYAEAEATLREAWDGDELQNWARFNTESMLGAALAAQGKYTEAEPYLVRGYEGMLERRPQVGSFYQTTLFIAESEPGERIVNMYQNWGKPEKVAEWRQKINGAPNFSLLPWSEFLQR